MTTLADILSNVGLSHLIDGCSDEDGAILDRPIEVHYQPSYPMKSSVVGVVAGQSATHLTLSESTTYSSKKVWQGQDPDEECEDD